MISLLIIVGKLFSLLAVIVKFRAVVLVLLVFAFFVWLFAEKTGVEVNVKKKRYRYVTPEGKAVYLEEGDLMEA